MVNKSVLRKLSNQELEAYLKEGNRFVPEAVQIAFEILEERGRIFNDQKKATVQQLIQRKKEAEEAKLNAEREIWQDYITEDPSAVKLFPRELILIISLLLGTIPGSLLLNLNFLNLKKYGAAVLALVFGFIFVPVQNFAVPFMYEHNSQHFFTYRKSPELLMGATGAVIFFVFWVLFTPKKLPYRAASYIFPILISLVMLVLMVTNDQGWFSGYFLVSFAK
ncbi:hypothetical protein [Chryseobacterium sp. Mn2064]|uniref:hypothetical protein n=1 Tax=Chryseobacterium sp. Mn2064 TaxID=3395263 RepID=UPI003BDA1500